jgi:N,N'-diacetyllegionaminate synthase
MKTYVIAEVGPNHNGSIKTAIQIVNALASCGVDAIKFQLADPDKVYSADAFKADYQRRNDGDESVIEMSRRLQLSHEDHLQLKKLCAAIGITYLCTAFDINSLKFLDEVINVPRFKIGSGEMLTLDMLEYMAICKKPVIMSTGMASLHEIADSLKVLRSDGLQDITLLHCVSNYPAPHADMNLLVMNELSKEFGCKVGFSDHSLGPASSLAAVALGACVIEKHVTIDRSMPGPDHGASSTVEEFSDMVTSIRLIEAAIGRPHKTFSASEEAIKLMARKSIIAVRDLPVGTLIGLDDLAFKRPGTGLSPMLRDLVIGKKTARDLKADHVIHLNDIEGLKA